MNLVTETKQSLFKALEEIGLTESETNLYITSLTAGPVAVATLATQLNIPRPNVYKLIASLEDKGLTKFSERKKYSRTLTVEPPTIVLEKLRQKREEMKDLDQDLASSLPDLLALHHQGDTLTKIKVLSGKEQWMKLFFQILEEAKDEMQFCGSADAFIEFISWETEREWIKRRVEKKIHINVLLTPGKDMHSLKEEDEFEMRTTKTLEVNKPFAPGFMLYANKVIIWQPKAPLALLIEDQYIVEMMRSLFDKLWSTSN